MVAGLLAGKKRALQDWKVGADVPGPEVYVIPVQVQQVPRRAMSPSFSFRRIDISEKRCPARVSLKTATSMNPYTL